MPVAVVLLLLAGLARSTPDHGNDNDSLVQERERTDQTMPPAASVPVAMPVPPVVGDRAGHRLVYDNHIVSGHRYRPGAGRELIDWGESPGGTIGKVEIRYTTTLSDPGQIIVRFYEGTSSTRLGGKLLAEHRLAGLKGSPDGGEYAFAHELIVPRDQRFDLPPGAFGYSLEFGMDQTGAELARGGRGNENMLWVDHTGPHHCGDPNIWAGVYLRLYALDTGQGRIRVEPSLLDVERRGERGSLRPETVPDGQTPTARGWASLMSATRHRQVYYGQGVAIAIIDAGVDYRHPQLGAGSFPNEKVIGGWDFGGNDPDPRPLLAHGTQCARIAAGDRVGPTRHAGGVAYGAKLYALKIKGQLGERTDFDTLAAALDWCIRHQYDDPLHPILVASISYGGKRSFTTCDGLRPRVTAAAERANQAGITILAASGNDGWTDSMDCPACISSVIAVGGTDVVSRIRPAIGRRVPAVTSYSNMAPILDLLAPAGWDDGQACGDVQEDSLARLGETSAACACAAGGVACLQSAAKDMLGRFLTPADVRSILVATGNDVFDEKAGISKPQINLDRAIESLVCRGSTFRIHNDGTGLLTISAIFAESGSRWLSVWPQTPFVIEPGQYHEICVRASSDVPDGNDRLIVFSDDPDPDPYCSGVLIRPR